MKDAFLSQAYNRNLFVSFLNEFLPDDFTPNETEVDLFGKQHYATQAIRLGKCKSLELEVFEIHHTSLKDARVGISKDAFNLLLHRSMCNKALIAFIPEDNRQWRFSLLEMEADINDRTNRIQRSYSNPHRYSYLLGINAKVKTPQQFIIAGGQVQPKSVNGKALTAWEDLKKRFSVEVLTKEFYDQLFHWFLWAIDKKTGVTFPNLTETPEDDYDEKPAKIIRLITRLLFVWFIKQKDLIPSQIFEIDELKKILADFDPKSDTQGVYYNAILQNLFFATLNQEIDKRAFINDYKDIKQRWSIKSLYRDDCKKSYFTPNYGHDKILELFHKVPYMNSGLFECLDTFELVDGHLKPVMYYDGFSSMGVRDSKTHHYKRRAFIPNSLFFSDVKEVTVTIDPETNETAEVKVQGLINIFQEYNFTIEENTPSDVQVSLDPELLGRVFENLLAAYNPETGTTVRKSTGSFYTPREIVDYMVEETLIAHLTTRFPNYTETIRQLVKNNEVTDSSALQALPKEDIIESLRTIKILDPACGSGAFPMGCLLKICNVIEALNPEGFNRYQTKLQLIQNCIYGVDIQPVAMLISKLRFFISLLCEQNTNPNDVEHNFGVDPLPNLDTKFVAANTLMAPDILKYKGDLINDDVLIRLKEELLEIRTKMFSIRTKETNARYLQADANKRKEIEDYIISQSGAPDMQKVSRLENEIARCKAEMKNYEGENWQESVGTVQTNLFGDVMPSIFRKDINKEKRQELENRIKLCEKDIQREYNKRNKDGFATAVHQVTEWNPFDQNHSSPFFDPEWMYGIKDGFDIVIGNPPYISAPSQMANEQLAKQRKILAESGRFTTTYQKWDLYIPFMELGIRYLCKKNAVFSMIVPFPLTNQLYSQKIREMLIHDCNMFELVDLNGTKVFENAAVSNCIPFVRNCPSVGETIISNITTGLSISKSFIQPHYKLIQDETKFVWNLSKNERNLKKYEHLNVLGDFCYISKGMCLFDEGGTFKKDDLLSTKKDAIHCKEYVEGKNIEKYKVNKIRYVEYNTKRSPNLLSRPTFPELYSREKIVFNILGHIQGTFDATGLMHNNSLNACVLWRELKGVTNKSILASIKRYSNYKRSDLEKLSLSVSLKYLLGIMNAKYMDEILALLRGDDYHIYPEHVRNIPIPIASPDVQQKIEDLVDKILEGKKKGTDTEEWETEIDKEVYKLYGVNPE